MQETIDAGRAGQGREWVKHAFVCAWDGRASGQSSVGCSAHAAVVGKSFESGCELGPNPSHLPDACQAAYR